MKCDSGCVCGRHRIHAVDCCCYRCNPEPKFCECGCNEETSGPLVRFRQGHGTRGTHQTPELIEARTRRGPEHYRWEGDAISEKGGRSRAGRLIPTPGPCVSCGDIPGERHHKDGDTSNNAPDNLIVLCRVCHMRLDGRLEMLRKVGQQPKNDRMRNELGQFE